MARSEDLLVRIDATTEQLRREMRQADQTISRSSQRMDRHLKQVDKAFNRLNRAASSVIRVMGAVGIAFGAREIIQFASRTINNAEAIERQSRALGLTIDRFQELQFTFRQYGLETDDVADALNTLADRAEDAKKGTQSYVDAFAMIGIEVDQLRGKDPDQLFRLFADAIQRTNDVGVRNTAVVRTMGDDVGNRLLPLLIEGSEGLDTMAARAHELNSVLSGETVRSTAEAARQMRELREEIRGNLESAILDNKEAILGMVGGLNALIDAAAQGNLLPDFFSRAEEGASGFRQELEKAARILLSLAGAKYGAALGSRFGPAGTIIGGAGGALTGYFSPDLLRLKVEIDGREQTLDELKRQLDAYSERKDELERQLDAAGRGMAGEPSPLTSKQVELNELRAEMRKIEDAIDLLESRQAEAKAETERALGRETTTSIPTTTTEDKEPEESPTDPLPPARTYDYEPWTVTGVDAQDWQRQADAEARDTLATLDSTYAAVQRYVDQLKKIDQVTKQLNLTDEQRIDLQEQARDEYLRTVTAAEQSTDKLARVADQMGFTFESAFEDAIINAQDFSDVLQGLADDIKRIILRIGVTQPLAGWLQSILPFGSPPARAAGGSVSADQAYLVGEQGPELFAPSSSGTIIPNHALAGGGEVDVTINIINESGTPLRARQGATRRGANGTVAVDMVVKSAIQRLDGQGELEGLFRRHGAARQGQF